MPASALAVTENGSTTPQKRQQPRIPIKVRQAVHLLATGECKTQRAAAERVGMSEQHLCRMLAREQIQAFLHRESVRTISTALPRASRRLVELIDAQSEHVAAKVSERILTSEGILKSDQASIAVNVDVRAGFVVDLTEPTLIGQQRTIDANPLKDNDPASDI